MGPLPPHRFKQFTQTYAGFPLFGLEFNDEKGNNSAGLLPLLLADCVSSNPSSHGNPERRTGAQIPPTLNSFLVRGL